MRLDPQWKAKLTDCLRSVGLLDIPFGQITLNVADHRIVDAEKRERVK